MFVIFFIYAYIARYLGPSDFGLLSYVQSFVGLFAVIATLGLDEIVVRNIVMNPRKENSYLGTAFLLKLIGGLFVLLFITLSIPFTNNDGHTNGLIFTVACSLFFQSLNVIDFSFQAKVQSKFVVFAQNFQLLASSIFKLTLIYIEAPLIYFAIALMLDIFFLAVGLLGVYLYNGGKPLHWQFDKTVARGFLKDSWPLILSGLVVSIYMKIDQLMIKNMLNNEANGHYSAAVKISELYYYFPIIICNTFFPAILNAKKRSIKLYYQRLQLLYNFLTCASITFALLATFSAKWIVDLLFGTQFTGTPDVLIIHVWASIFVALGVGSAKWLISENMQLFSFYRTLLGAVVNVILNLFLIPRYGISGAAIATLIAQMSVAIFADLFSRKTRRALKMKFFGIRFFSA